MELTKKNDFVEIEFTGKANDQVFDTNNAEELKKIAPEAKPKKTIVIIGKGMVLAELDKALEEKEIGKEYELQIPSKEAFGPRRKELIKIMPLKTFTEKEVMPRAGMTFTLDNLFVKIIAVSGARVTADFNAPLAGKDLHYKFKILRKVENEEEKVKVVFEFLLRFIPEFEIKDKVIVKGPVVIESHVKEISEKFKELIGKELAFELKEDARIEGAHVHEDHVHLNDEGHED